MNNSFLCNHGLESVFQDQRCRANTEECFLQSIKDYKKYRFVKNGPTTAHSNYICSQHTPSCSSITDPSELKRLRDVRNRPRCNRTLYFLYGSHSNVFTFKRETYHAGRCRYRGLYSVSQERVKRLAKQGLSHFRILNIICKEGHKFVLCRKVYYS